VSWQTPAGIANERLERPNEETTMSDALIDLAAKVRAIPDFPKEGILFRDIMPLLQDPSTLREAVDRIVEYGTGRHVDIVLGAEARGFILGAAVAYGLGAGFVCARKPGKLPYETISAEYDLEYGTDRLEVHADAIKPGQNVLIHDDLLATGGTARAKIELVEKLGGKVVGIAFLIELAALKGRDKLEGYDVFSLIIY
jgi:adenine phosphoribosyltransferase